MQYFSSIHATAIAFANVGIPVFPCEAGGKKPVTQNGFYDSTTDLSIIEAWWKENPEYNLAICPDYAGLFVVDIDPGADLSVFAMLPETYQVRTPRGGWHLYYSGSATSSVGKVGEHIDTRGIGGYVLVPPSCVDGKRYILEEDRDYQPIPSWVKSAIKASTITVAAATSSQDLPENIERARKVLQKCVDQDDVAVAGHGGDDHTYRLCCEMLDLGLSAATARDLMEEIWNPFCIPQWTASELDKKLENAIRFRQNDPGAYAIESPEKVFGDIAKKLVLPEKLSRFHFKDEGELDDEPDPTWLVKDLISERSTVMMYGASGSYKSFLALDICLAIATGKPTFGSDTKSGLVFYGALEGKAHLKKARRAWRTLHGIEGKIENFFVGRAPMIGMDGEMQEFGDEIRKRCGKRNPTLIIIDTLSKSMAGMNENDAADAGRFIQFCDNLVDAFGCTVIAIHHNGKEENRGARGSSAFLAGFDTVLEVKAHKNCKAVAVHVRKHKDAEEREAPWTFEGRVTGASLTFEATTPEQHRLLVGDSKDITPKTVGATLKALNAFGEPAGVSTAVLATELTIPKENETVEDRAAAIARTGRALTTQAKVALEAYCTRHGKNLVWFLPAPL
jgi:AAA domain/Bifunctional DNA primase/polymerase, N-terminal